MKSLTLFKFCFVLLLLNQCLAKSFSNYENSFNERIKREEPNDEENDENDVKTEESVTDIEGIPDPNENSDKNDDKNVEDSSENEEEGDIILTDDDQLPEVSQEGSKLLIILVDGFRWDYVSLDKSLKGLRKIAENGVRAKYVKPIFPANSYPNWYSIVTGLYGESHGIIQNYMYDKSRDDVFLMAPHPGASHNHWWNQSEPLWITATKKGVKTAMYLWDGCQVKIEGIRPSICHRYRALYDSVVADNETRTYINTILDDFSNDKYRLALLYYELVDHFGHEFGPRSRRTKQAIRDIDHILNDLYDDIIERKMDEDLNVVIVSDHGMISLENMQRIHMEKILDFNDVDIFLTGGAIAQILPEEGKEEEVYQQLRQAQVKGLNVYRKDNIPERFHFKDGKNVLPILLTADQGYLIDAPRIKSKVYPDNEVSDEEPSGGGHGFDPDHVEEMRGIMYAFGPAFRQNYTSEPLAQIDHYNLFCNLIDITPNPNNGSLPKIEKLFKTEESEESEDESDENGEEAAQSEDDSEDGVSINKLHSILFIWITIQTFYLTFEKLF